MDKTTIFRAGAARGRTIVHLPTGWMRADATPAQRAALQVFRLLAGWFPRGLRVTVEEVAPPELATGDIVCGITREQVERCVAGGDPLSAAQIERLLAVARRAVAEGRAMGLEAPRTLSRPQALAELGDATLHLERMRQAFDAASRTWRGYGDMREAPEAGDLLAAVRRLDAARADVLAAQAEPQEEDEQVTCGTCGQLFDPAGMNAVVYHEQVPHRPMEHVGAFASRRAAALGWMMEVGVEGDRFNPHRQAPSCEAAGCQPAQPHEIPGREAAEARCRGETPDPPHPAEAQWYERHGSLDGYPFPAERWNAVVYTSEVPPETPNSRGHPRQGDVWRDPDGVYAVYREGRGWTFGPPKAITTTRGGE